MNCSLNKQIMYCRHDHRMYPVWLGFHPSIRPEQILQIQWKSDHPTLLWKCDLDRVLRNRPDFSCTGEASCSSIQEIPFSIKLPLLLWDVDTLPVLSLLSRAREWTAAASLLNQDTLNPFEFFVLTQMKAFRDLYYNKESSTPNEPMVNNYRPVQALNSRIMLKSVRDDEEFEASQTSQSKHCIIYFRGELKGKKEQNHTLPLGRKRNTCIHLKLITFILFFFFPQSGITPVQLVSFSTSDSKFWVSFEPEQKKRNFPQTLNELATKKVKQTLPCAGPSFWEKKYPECGWSQQSPIDIVQDQVVPEVIFPDFEFSGYTDLPHGARYTVENNGHSGRLFLCSVRTLPWSCGQHKGLAPSFKFLNLWCFFLSFFLSSQLHSTCTPSKTNSTVFTALACPPNTTQPSSIFTGVATARKGLSTPSMAKAFLWR